MLNPPIRGMEYTFTIALISQADTKLFQVNPTLASGDVKISKDNGAEANLNTLPTVTPSGGRHVKVTVSATEMTANSVSIIFSDASGAEWCDQQIEIKPASAIMAGVATTGGSATSVPTSSHSVAPNSTSQWTGRILIFDLTTTTVALRGAGSPILSHTNSSTPTFTLSDGLPATPAAGDTYKIY